MALVSPIQNAGTKVAAPKGIAPLGKSRAIGVPRYMLLCDCMILYGIRFGVCCWFTLQNTGELSQNCTYVQNPGYPSAYTDTASLKYTIRRCSEGSKEAESYVGVMNI